MQISKKKKTDIPRSTEAPKRLADARLAWAAGSEHFAHRDPLYHVTEDFQQTFDRIGMKYSRRAAGEEDPQGAETDAWEPQEKKQKKQKETTKAPGEEEKQTGGPMLWAGNVPSALTAFSETAFQRGAMSAAVLNGTGKMMLVSCLKRTVGQSGPKRLQEQTVFGTGSQVRNIPGRSPDQMVFNRGFAGGALGIVVDTLRDARRVVDSMADMARGTGELSSPDNEALRRMYPFLDDSRDAALEAEYREKLAACTDEREKPVLQNALVHASALRAKKAQMKNEFINKLRFISDRATETLSELEAPGIEDELAAALLGDLESEFPENPEEGGDGDAPNRPKNRTDAGDREGTENTADTKAKP